MRYPGGIVKIAAVAGCAIYLFAAGCSGRACPAVKCPRTTVAFRALNDSTVTWMLQGAAPQTTTGFIQGTPPAGACSFRNFPSFIFATPGADAGDESLREGYLDIQCSGAGTSGLTLVVNKVGDARDWSAGTFTTTAPAGDLFLDYFSVRGGSQPMPAPGHCDTAEVDGGPVIITVETATGTRAPLPKTVTDDFVRTFRFDFDTAAGAATISQDGIPCQLPITVQASLHLTQTAADYVHDEDFLCACE
jgi:hypothetical protein